MGNWVAQWTACARKILMETVYSSFKFHESCGMKVDQTWYNYYHGHKH